MFWWQHFGIMPWMFEQHIVSGHKNGRPWRSMVVQGGIHHRQYFVRNSISMQ